MLPSQEVHIWSIAPEQIDKPHLLQRYANLLSPSEIKRGEKLSHPKVRTEYLIARGWIRTVLSQYYPIPPSTWCFTQNPYGRPEILTPIVEPRIYFNLSHTDGLLVCGVLTSPSNSTRISPEIGIDVENINRKVSFLKIAEKMFSPSEFQTVRNAPSQLQKTLFLKIWTLKEAYIKAKGMGLAIPLDQFSFNLKDENKLEISFGPQLKDTPQDWQFKLLQPTPHHQIAIAVRSVRGTPHPLYVEKFLTPEVN